MRLNKWSAMGLAMLAGSAMMVRQVSAQGGTPSAAPKPANTQPSPANTQPDPANSQPRGANNPGTVQPQVVPNRPTTPAGQQPANQQPANGQPITTIGPNGQPVVVVPNGTNGNNGSGTGVTGTGLGRYERPFMFQTPGIEARFTENSRRLIGLEQRLATSNQMLLKRLGEVRTLPPEKQNAALADIVQQMLMEQAQMQKYLVMARTAWTGDIEGVPAEMPENGVPVATPTDDSPRGVPTSAVPGSAVPSTAVPTNPPR